MILEENEERYDDRLKQRRKEIGKPHTLSSFTTLDFDTFLFIYRRGKKSGSEPRQMQVLNKKCSRAARRENKTSASKSTAVK